jgi:hypothetical protein
VTGLLGHLVDPDRVEDDPHDREDAERGAERRRVGGLPDRHAVDGHGDHQRDRERGEPRPLGRHLEAPEKHEQRDERQHREDGRQAQRVAYRIEYLFVHPAPPNARCCLLRCAVTKEGARET